MHDEGEATFTYPPQRGAQPRDSVVPAVSKRTPTGVVVLPKPR
jgi:hypothetical protein